MKRLVVSVFCVLTTLLLCAQESPAIFRESIQKMGAWKDVRNVHYTSLQISYNKWQSYDYNHPSGNRNVLQFSYDLVNSRYFYTTDSYYGGGYHFSYANIGKDSVRYSFDQLGNRDGKKMAKQGKAQFVTGANFLQQFIPYYLLKSLTTGSDSFYVVEENGETIVRRNLKQNGSESFYFNAEQQLTRHVIVQGGQKTDRVFKNYITAGGLDYASIIDNYVNGVLLTHDSLFNVSTEPLHAGRLQVPAGYTIDTIPVVPKVSTLSDRVYLIENVPGGRNMMFVEMKDGIFVTEAPLSAEVSQAMIDLIHRTVPGKQISHVHLSHFHNDHTNGIRAFAAEGATIVASGYTIGVIRGIVDDSSGRFRDKFAAMKKPGEYQSLSNFNNNVGKGIIQLLEMQNNHAKGMSFVYLPAEKIIYEGDLYSLPADGTITPAIEITRQFVKYIKKKKLNPSRIIGHHGNSNITPAILKIATRK